MLPDHRASAIVISALVGLCAAEPALAQNLQTWSLPDQLRAAPYAARSKMLPDPSAGLPTKGFGAAGGRLDSTFLIENRGTVELSFVVAGSTGICGKYRVRPNDIIPATRCGERVAWHDGHRTRELETKAGGVYQFFWSTDRWDLEDVTARRFE